MSLDDELIQAFLEESTENLDQLDLDLIALESSPGDPELLDRVFRTIHTIKGTCGFLNYGRLEALAHAGEDLLADLREGRLTLDAEITTSLLRLVDQIRAVLVEVERTGTEGDLDHSEIISDLMWQRERPQDEGAAQRPAAPSATHAAATTTEETSVRIDVTVLDRLQDLVGELTLARMRVGDYVPDDGGLAHAFHQLTIATRDLQDTVMQARLQPVSTATDRLRRIVRDVAAEEGKIVDLLIEGGDVSVDKTINEILRDPLVHLVRNAVDHGIETPAERALSGKPAQATLCVEAAVIGGGFQIEVTDDGRGIDTSALVDRAVSSGRLTAEQAAAMTQAQQTSLLFLPGISTAREVTTVSGRGVGMDVVRTNLERIGGSIDVSSTPGSGATFRISVPLTLAILPAIVVSSGDCRYTIAQADVQAIVHVPADAHEELIETVGSARFMHHHATLVPLIDLAEYLGTSSGPPTGPLEIVVIRHLDSAYGLVVDAVGDSLDVVVKPLPRVLRSVACYAGVTVLSDGRPSLILETAAPAAHAGLTPHPDEVVDEDTGEDPALKAMLLVTIADSRLAVPVEDVSRLLRVGVDAVEHSGHDEVVQYHEHIVPLIRVSQVLGLDAAPHSGDSLTIVVCTAPDGDVGLVVDEVVDIGHADPRLAEPMEEPCLPGRLVIDDRVTELVDVAALVQRGLLRRRGTGGAQHG